MGAITRRRAAMSSQEVSPRASFALIEPEMKPQSPPAQVDAEWDLVTHGSNAPRDLAEERSEKRDPWFSAEGNDQGLALVPCQRSCRVRDEPVGFRCGGARCWDHIA